MSITSNPISKNAINAPAKFSLKIKSIIPKITFRSSMKQSIHSAVGHPKKCRMKNSPEWWTLVMLYSRTIWMRKTGSTATLHRRRNGIELSSNQLSSTWHPALWLSLLSINPTTAASIVLQEELTISASKFVFPVRPTATSICRKNAVIPVDPTDFSTPLKHNARIVQKGMSSLRKLRPTAPR